MLYVKSDLQQPLHAESPNRVISGPYFPVFRLNTERYSVSPCIQYKYRKIQTRNNSVFGHFSCSEHLLGKHIKLRRKIKK